MWNAEGQFDEKRYEQLCSMVILDQGKKIVTRQAFHNLRRMKTLDKVAPTTTTTTCTRVFYVIPISWAAVTNGSIEELFTYYADHWYMNEKGQYEEALTLEHVRAFYQDPVAVMQRRTKEELPAAKPKA